MRRIGDAGPMRPPSPSLADRGLRVELLDDVPTGCSTSLWPLWDIHPGASSVPRPEYPYQIVSRIFCDADDGMAGLDVRSTPQGDNVKGSRLRAFSTSPSARPD
jgi:hypothetical protein